MQRIITAKTGDLVRYSYVDENGETVRVEGRKGRQLGMPELGNQGYILDLSNGQEIAITRYAMVEVAGIDFLVDDPKPVLHLWGLYRKDETNTDEMVACIVVATTATEAQTIAAAHAKDEGAAVWFTNEFQLTVDCLGTADDNQTDGMILADIHEA